LLRMTCVFDGIKQERHPEEPAKRASRRTHRANPRKGARGVTAGPLTVAELAAALDAIGGFEARPFIAVAVSGGPDSLALVLLAEKWARQHGGGAPGRARATR